MPITFRSSCLLPAAVLVLISLVVSAPVHAQSSTPPTAPASPAQFTSVTVFGDSYADTGAAPGGAFRILGWTKCPIGPTVGYPTCHFTDGTNFADTLQSIYRLPPLLNYAIGGAGTDTYNTLGASSAGFRNELDKFAASGMRFTNTDLIALSIGGNDTTLPPSSSTIAQINTMATTAAANATAGVQRLVAAGAHNIAWFGAGSTIYFPASNPGSDGLPLSTVQRTAWAHTYFQQVQELMAPAARSGVRIFLFDFETLQARLRDNPGQYGFASATGCQTSLGAVGCFYWNGVHPNSAGMALVATYMANQMDAPLTVIPQGRVTTAIAEGFAYSLLGRFDADRGSQHARTPSSSTQTASAARWSIYGELDNFRTRTTLSSFPVSSEGHATGGTAGLDYRLNPTLQLGIAFGYSSPDITTEVQNASDRVRAFQFAGHASFTNANWFADSLLAYGRQSHALDRQGVIDIVRASPVANTWTTAGRVGYMAHAGRLQVGPVATLAYSRGTIGGYTETGDSLVTMVVDRQTFDHGSCDAGIQARIPFAVGQSHFNPFVSVAVASDISASGRTVTTTQVTTPLLPVLTDVPRTTGTYGRVGAGIGATLTERLSAAVHGTTTFGRDGRSDFGLSGGFRLSLR